MVWAVVGTGKDGLLAGAVECVLPPDLMSLQVQVCVNWGLES